MSAERLPLPLVQLRATPDPADTSRSLTAKIELAISKQPIQLEITVPGGPTRITNLLPIFQGMAEVVVSIAELNVITQGQTISCCKGCGACCRQLVPISEMEARALAALVEAMPEPRRSIVRQRFAEARERLLQAGLNANTQEQGSTAKAQLRALGLEYFSLGIACPFLEEESCSIHPDRPLACREYLVTSPASACAKPTAETIQMVPIPAGVAQAARTLERQTYGDQVQWMPLIAALAWVEQHPDEPPPEHAITMLQAFFKNLAGNIASPNQA